MVGNSVNCHAEMSADIASIPSWKIALLERKRLHDKELSGSSVNHTPSAASNDQQAVVDSGLPAWKRDILARKLNQTNSSVFLAKHGQTDDNQSGSTASTVNNGHVHSLVYDSLCGSVEPELDGAVVDIDINDTLEDQPVEERLLPIHQNPILRLDLKKRQSSSGSARSSISPRVTSTSGTSSSGGSNEHVSTVSSVSSHVCTTPEAVNEEVFSNDNDDNDCETEVAYGKGFVHKLLMKFTNLSSSGCDQTANNRHSKPPRFHSLGDSHKLSSTGPRRQSSRDLESIPSKPSSSMPATKYHSADDLLNETEFHPRIDGSDSADELDVTATNDINGECSGDLDYSAVEDDAVSKRNSSSAEIVDELPFANIVSNARSLFESLAVHSTSQKQPTSPSSMQNTTSGRFPYVGTLERSHPLKRTLATRTDTQEGPKISDQSHSSLNRPEKSTAEVSRANGTTLAADDEESSQGNADARIEIDATEPVQATKISSCAVVDSSSSPSSTHAYSSVLNQDVNISATAPLKPASNHADSNTSENSVHFPKSSTKEKEYEKIPSASVAQSKTFAAESGPFASNAVENTSTMTARPVHVDSSSLFSQFADNKENIKSHPAAPGKKPAPSRPGKLVIRPASNLVAAKTSTEYLELTKYNDVRKGEFAPPVKKERPVPDAYDDDTDKSDGVADDSVIREEYVFTGAGVIIGRSLLTKTNRKKLVNNGNLLFFVEFLFLTGFISVVSDMRVYVGGRFFICFPTFFVFKKR